MCHCGLCLGLTCWIVILTSRLELHLSGLYGGNIYLEAN